VLNDIITLLTLITLGGIEMITFPVGEKGQSLMPLDARIHMNDPPLHEHTHTQPHIQALVPARGQKEANFTGQTNETKVEDVRINTTARTS